MSYFPKILIIDDEEDFCCLVKRNLESTGEYKVFVAYNAADGIILAKVEKPDVILLDIMMPDISGAQAAAALKKFEETRDIPVIFLTAIITKEELGTTMKEIADNLYIAKPVKTQELIDSIQSVLKKHRSI
ncbi:MAG: response regulator [Candidatus Omnitrophota bacterium]